MPLIGHYKASEGVTLVGSKVSAWADQSGNSNHLEQTVDAVRPEFVASALNGHPAIRFAGAEELVGANNGILAISDIFATIAAAIVPNTGATITIIAKRNVENGYLFRMLSTSRVSSHWTENSDRRLAVQSSALSVDGVFTVLHIDLHSSIAPLRNIYVNGVLDNAVDINEQVPSTIASTGIVRMGSTEGGGFFDGDMHEVRVYKDLLVDKDEMFEDLNVYSQPFGPSEEVVRRNLYLLGARSDRNGS